MNGIRKVSGFLNDFSRSENLGGSNEAMRLPVIEKTLCKLDELAILEDNWDSYSGLKPSSEAMLGAVQFVYDMLQENTPEPWVFPVPNGNIQFEWSCLNIDLEVEVTSRQKMLVSYENLETEEQFEREFGYDLRELQRVIQDLTAKNDTRRRLIVVGH